jgi:enoyl-CoA hydratase/carnithine racemase
VLIVDLSAGSAEPPAADLAAARAALARLPCPSVALCREPPPGPAAALLRHACDVVVADAAGLEAVLRAVERRPLAAMALVQLLRHGEGLGIHAALFAESLVYSMLQSGPEYAAWRAARGGARSAAPPPSAGPAVEVLRDGARLHLTLNRPEKHNAFSAEMRDALVDGLRIAANDPSIREVTLSGAGPSFCSGGDLDEFGTLPDPATAHAIRSTRNASRLLADCAERVCARVHGACVGAGVELPAFARRVVAAEDAFFQLPELEIGLVPGAGGSVSLPRRIGRQRTAWLALSGARLDARRALEWGLVDELAPARGGG